MNSPNYGLKELRLHFGCWPDSFDSFSFSELYYRSAFSDTPSEKPFLIIRRSVHPDPAYWLAYEDGTNVVVSGNLGSIWVNWSEQSSSIEDATTYLLGPVMAVILQLRGETCLHGSAVALSGVAIALLGAQGAGKSTTAAAFARSGYPVISDDIVLLTETGGEVFVEPAYPGVRLWPSSVELLFGTSDALPKLSPTWNKRGLNLNQEGYSFQKERLPLAAIYILGSRGADDAAPFLVPVSGIDAVRKIAPHAWGHYAMAPDILARQFKLLTKLSKRLPIREVTAHESPTRLPQLLQLLADDARATRLDKGLS